MNQLIKIKKELNIFIFYEVMNQTQWKKKKKKKKKDQ
jgi:hypothetical protein